MSRAEFLRGATAVIAHIKTFDGGACGTLYNESVEFIGADALIAQARRDGAMRWSGLDQYVRSDRYRRRRGDGAGQ
jgi:hypothetical protein